MEKLTGIQKVLQYHIAQSLSECHVILCSGLNRKIDQNEGAESMPKQTVGECLRKIRSLSVELKAQREKMEQLREVELSDGLRAASYRVGLM
jgi:hypothetical protein